MFGIFANPAKRYARELGPWLVKSYGRSSDYTEGQVRRGVRELRLDPRYIAFGYAAFMKEEAFEALRDRMPVKFPYQEARARFARFVRRSPDSSLTAGESTIDPSDVALGLDFHFHDGGPAN